MCIKINTAYYLIIIIFIGSPYIFKHLFSKSVCIIKKKKKITVMLLLSGQISTTTDSAFLFSLLLKFRPCVIKVITPPLLPVDLTLRTLVYPFNIKSRYGFNHVHCMHITSGFLSNSSTNFLNSCPFAIWLLAFHCNIFNTGHL